ncbi:NUDIX domain-containing protein [Nocardia mangyaensis]|uniref:NUDIX domain-containing protein n=1 Tax=Nocardia mangyaensis TaxID=2213200 RepID=UPI0023E46419|nr:NUDIX domain-containing protein [Nocardia mangyaensis]
MIGGAVSVGESYEQAAARELAEELGVRTRPRFVEKFLCEGEIAPYWLAIHDVVIDVDVHPDPAEIAWCDWIPETALRSVLGQWLFVPDSIEAFHRFAAQR